MFTVIVVGIHKNSTEARRQLDAIRSSDFFRRSPEHPRPGKLLVHLATLVELWIDEPAEVPTAKLKEKWNSDSERSVQTQISHMRAALRNYYASDPTGSEESECMVVEGNVRKGYSIAFKRPTETSIRQTLAVSPQWDQVGFEDLVSKLQSPAILRIQTTYLLETTKFFPMINDAVDRRVRVRILLLSADAHPLIRARFRLRNDTEVDRVHGYLVEQVERLRKLEAATEGLVQVRECDVMPFGFFAYADGRPGDEWMRVGLMPPTTSYLLAPAISLSPRDRVTWARFQKAWGRAWAESTDDLRYRHGVLTTDAFPEARILNRMATSSRFRVVITASQQLQTGKMEWVRLIEQALIRGAVVELLLWDEDSELVHLRTATVGERDSGYVARIIRENKKKIVNMTAKIVKKKTFHRKSRLTIRTSASLTATHGVQFEDEIYFGLYWNRKNAMADHFIGDPKRGVGRSVKEQFDYLWRHAAPFYSCTREGAQVKDGRRATGTKRKL